MKQKKILITAALGVALAGWLWWGNSALMTSKITVTSQRLPAGFEGFRIAQISDLHNTQFGDGNEVLLSALKQAKPDIIVLTGDLIDCRHIDIPVAVAFVQEAVNIAPCYYVTGNHEARIPNLSQLLEGLSQAGVTMLRNEAVTLERHGDTITLMGVDDPSFEVDYMTGDCRPEIGRAHV